MFTSEHYHAALERDAAAFAEIMRAGDLGREVVACPGWTTQDLAEHLGGVHRWAAQVIVTGAPGEAPVGPSDRDEISTWFTDGAARLLDLLRTTDPGAPTWTFGPQPQLVSFWSRRQAHETAIHLWDARRAQGEASALDTALAADGVDEVISVIFPRQVRLGRIPPLTHGVRIVLSDGPKTSYVLAGDGTDLSAATESTVTGPAERVLLALWGRVDLEGLDVTGDPALVRATLKTGFTP